MKKILALFIACMLLLTACSSGSSEMSSSESKDVKEIAVWAWDPNFNIKAMEIAKDVYKDVDSKLKIKVVEMAQDDIVQKLNTTLSSGSTKGLPNIVLIEDYRSQGFLKSYPDMFYDLTGTYKTDDFASYKVAANTLSGKNYGVPFDSGVTGLYVRTDYLQKAGYSVNDLQNIDWDKYIEIGKKIKKATGKQMLTQDPKDLGLIRMMIQSSGSP